MGNARVQLAALLVAGALATSAARPARADADAGDAKSAARTRGEQGLQLFESGRWADAYAAFREADRLYHAPTLTLFMGHCRRNQGNLVEARALYAKLVGEPVPVAAPEQFRKAQAQARVELEGLRARIPRLVTIVTGPGATEAQVEIDGAPVGAAATTTGTEVDPGKHALVAKAPGASARRTVTLAEGEEARLELALVADPVAPTAPPPGQIDARPGPRGAIAPGVITLGAGGVGVILGAITGAIAAAKIGDIRSRCQTIAGAEHCLVADIPARDAAQTWVTVSTIGFVVGGAALLGGTALLVFRPGGAPAAARLEIDAGPTAIHLRGSF